MFKKNIISVYEFIKIKISLKIQNFIFSIFIYDCFFYNNI